MALGLNPKMLDLSQGGEEKSSKYHLQAFYDYGDPATTWWLSILVIHLGHPTGSCL